MTTAQVCSVVQLNVYDRDATTLRDSVSATGVQWSDVLGDVGSASLSAPLMQAVMQATPDLFSEAIVKVATNLTTDPDDLTEIFGFLAEGGEWSLIGDQEAAGEARSLQCRGLLALAADWIVYPENGFQTYGADRRAFGWMSKSTAHSFDESQWDGTIAGKKWSAVSSTADRYHKPKGWPDHNAWWISVNSREHQRLVRSFTLDEDCEIVIFASADENLRCFVDSERIIKNNSHGTGYTELSHWRRWMTEGEHTFGMHFTKERDVLTSFWGVDFTYADIDRGIVSCYKVKANGSYGELIFHK